MPRRRILAFGARISLIIQRNRHSRFSRIAFLLLSATENDWVIPARECPNSLPNSYSMPYHLITPNSKAKQECTAQFRGTVPMPILTLMLRVAGHNDTLPQVVS